LIAEEKSPASQEKYMRDLKAFLCFSEGRQITKELIKRQIAGETILVPVGKTVYDANGLFVLNELGAFIWDMLPQAESEEAICKAVLEEYDAVEEEVRRDVTEFLDALRTWNIL
jgi:hypothetical protein